MFSKKLPVLNFAPFRKYPTKRDQQEFADDRQVCHNCISGACCSNQDAIALTSFDIFRLAAFFDISPAKFMLTFTQDKFDREDEDFRRGWNNNPKSSVVTWLRRRANFGYSPCIFLKYIRDPDGTPRRICSVHDARPLSCREYYFSHCKARGTGELASLLAEGFEKVRDGEITEEMVDAELARFGAHNFETATLAESMEYSFWAEMKCVLNMDQANVEGSNSYNIADYQDPIDEKLNRVLSAKYLRSEENYGLKPHGEQLIPYTSGLSFAGSSEYERIMVVVNTPPSSGLYELGNYPYYVGVRTMMPGVKHADLFPVIPDAEIGDFLNGIPPVHLFPDHDLKEVRSITLRDLYAAVLKAYNHLIRFSSHIVTLEPILEYDPPGTIEVELFKMIAGFETSLNPYIAYNPYLQPIKYHMAEATVDLLEKELAEASDPETVFNCLRSLCIVRPVMSTLPPDLRARIEAVNLMIHTKLQKDKLDLYVSMDNPVEMRRVAGKPLGESGALQAWEVWYGQVLDMRYAALAGFDEIDLASFYRRTMDDLEKLPLRRSYAVYLYEMMKHLAHSMTYNQRISYKDMPDKNAANRFAAYGIALFNWTWGKEEIDYDCETAAELLFSVYKSMGLNYNHDRNFGLIIYRLLSSQLSEGSWKTNLSPEEAPDSQGEFLEVMYRATWACVDALRPMRNDLLNPANAALGLI